MTLKGGTQLWDKAGSPLGGRQGLGALLFGGVQIKGGAVLQCQHSSRPGERAWAPHLLTVGLQGAGAEGCREEVGQYREAGECRPPRAPASPLSLLPPRPQPPPSLAFSTLALCSLPVGVCASLLCVLHLQHHHQNG